MKSLEYLGIISSKSMPWLVKGIALRLWSPTEELSLQWAIGIMMAIGSLFMASLGH